jgi:hypothetical protein
MHNPPDRLNDGAAFAEDSLAAFRIGEAATETQKKNAGAARKQYEKKKRREEEFATLIGLASLAFIGLVGYLVYTTMLAR